MNNPKNQQNEQTPSASHAIKDTSVSSSKHYMEMVVGSSSIWDFCLYELVTLFCSQMPAAIGYILRRFCYRWILGDMGKNVTIGRGVVLRGAKKIHLGNNVVIDDNSVLDARGSESSITLGDCVLVSRNTVIRTRSGAINIGQGCDIGCNCILATDTQLTLGRKILIGAYTYLVGGGNHEFADTDKPIIEQPIQNKGGITVEDDVWIGTRVTIMDGIKIGTGAVIGAHSLVRTSIPPKTISYGIPAKPTRSR